MKISIKEQIASSVIAYAITFGFMQIISDQYTILDSWPLIVAITLATVYSIYKEDKNAKSN